MYLHKCEVLPLDTFHREFRLTYQENTRQVKKGKWERKEGKSKNGKVENWNWKEEKLQN